MKKFLLVLSVILLSQPTIWAHDFAAQNDEGVTIYYNITSSTDRTCEVTYYSTTEYNSYTASSVEIPSSVKYNNTTYSVTSIGSNAFWFCKSLTSVTIPESVTSIGHDAFSGCSSLTSVTIPNSVTSIGYDAFSGCSSLETLIIGNSVTSIGSYAFMACTSLTSVTIGESMTSIGSDTFYGCTGVKEIIFNAMAWTSSRSIFSDFTNLTTVTIGDNVTTIPSPAFQGCTMRELTIGTSVTSIEDNAFNGCTGVKEINFNATACTSGSFSGCTNLSTVTIGDNVTTLADYLFKGCPNITELTAKSTTPPTIYSNTFEEIPPYLEPPMSSLNKYALAPFWSEIPIIYANNRDGSVYYPVPIYYEGSVVLNISGSDEDDGAIATKGSSMEITPYKANNLTYGLIMHETENITSELINNGSYSFSVSEFHKENTIYCYSPKTENIYDITVSSAGEVLNQITVNDINSVYSLKITGDINGTDITTIRKMFNLKLLDISEANVVSGGEQYYDNYTTSNNKIGKYFFYDMDWLLLVKIPNSVTEIETYAFGNCTGLMTMTIPKNVTSIADHAFSSCTNLTDLTFEDGTSRLSLSSSAYSESPIAIMYIGRDLNYQGSTLPFRNLDTLKSLTIGNRVNSLIDYEFAGCTNLTTLSLGNTITSIGDNAFDGCVSLLEINSKNPTPPELESNTFKDVDKETCILNVPTGSLNDYWLHKYWRDFFNIQEKDFPTSGIDEVGIDGETDATEVARYTIDGRQLSAPQKGVNIILYSDGSAKKVFVK